MGLLKGETVLILALYIVKSTRCLGPTRTCNLTEQMKVKNRRISMWPPQMVNVSSGLTLYGCPVTEGFPPTLFVKWEKIIFSHLKLLMEQYYAFHNN